MFLTLLSRSVHLPLSLILNFSLSISLSPSRSLPLFLSFPLFTLYIYLSICSLPPSLPPSEYLAPEILENKGHGKAVDWWSLGTLLFEMVCGLPPFYDTNVQRMYHKILHSPLKFPQK